MKRISAVILLVLFLIFSLAFSGNAKDISIEISTKVLGKYIGSNGGLFRDDRVLQTDFFVLFPSGFYLDLWHSMGLDGTSASSDYGDELDYTIGWTGVLYGNFILNTGISYFDLVDLFYVPGGDVVQPYLEIKRSFSPIEKNTLTPYLKLEAAFPENPLSTDDGLYVHGGLKHALEFKKFAIGQKLDTVYDSSVYGNDTGVIFQYDLNLSLKLLNYAQFVLYGKFSTPLSSLSDSRRTEKTAGVGITFQF